MEQTTTKSTSTGSYLRVMCEGCIKQTDTECPICGGNRFYLWDPQSFYCFTEKGQQIFYANDKGELLPVTRQQSVKPILLSADNMLQFIEQWVAQIPVRKWKLLLDENGWQSCVWFNRYKHSCVQIAEPNFAECVKRTYEKIAEVQDNMVYDEDHKE